MNDGRTGTVGLEVGGESLSLRFTWERIDALGRNGVVERLTRAESGEPGDCQALAELIEAASGGALTAASVMADPPPINVAYVRLLEAWALALHGPTRKAKEQRADRPMNRLRTWLSTHFRRLLRRD